MIYLISSALFQKFLGYQKILKGFLYGPKGMNIFQKNPKGINKIPKDIEKIPMSFEKIPEGSMIKYREVLVPLVDIVDEVDQFGNVLSYRVKMNAKFCTFNKTGEQVGDMDWS